MAVDKEAVHFQKMRWFMSMLLFSPGLVPFKFSFMVVSQWGNRELDADPSSGHHKQSLFLRAGVFRLVCRTAGNANTGSGNETQAVAELVPRTNSCWPRSKKCWSVSFQTVHRSTQCHRVRKALKPGWEKLRMRNVVTGASTGAQGKAELYTSEALWRRLTGGLGGFSRENRLSSWAELWK